MISEPAGAELSSPTPPSPQQFPCWKLSEEVARALAGISRSRERWALQRLGFHGPSHGPQAPPGKFLLVAFSEWKMQASPVRGFC